MGGAGRGRVPERILGADRLLDHLTSQIALCGSHGAGSNDFRLIVQQWFHEFQEPPSTAPIEEKTYERLWEWIRRRPDVRIYLRGERRDLSFAEFQDAERTGTGDPTSLNFYQQSQSAYAQGATPGQSNSATSTTPRSLPPLKNDKIRELLRARLAKEPHLIKENDRLNHSSESSNRLEKVTSLAEQPTVTIPVSHTNLHVHIPGPFGTTIDTNAAPFRVGATASKSHDDEASARPDQEISQAPDLEDTAVLDKVIKRGHRKVVPKGYVRNDNVSGEVFDTEVSMTTVPRLYASQSRTWQAVAGHSVDLQRLPGMLFVLLSIIASRGANGILQPELVKLSGQDKRSVPHRTDKLAKMGYIEKNPVQAAGARTSLLIHKKLVRQGHFLKGPGGVEDVFRGDQIILTNFIPLLYNTLKDVDAVPLRSLRQRLNMSLEDWPTRTVRSTIERLEESGLLKRVRARRKGSVDRWLPCVKLLREPNDADMKVMRFRRKQVQQAPTEKVLEEDEEGDDVMRDMELEIESDGEIDVLEPKGEIKDITRIPPQWTPERLVPHLVLEAVSLAGPNGYDTAEVRDRTMGKFWKRPVENVLARMTEDWEKSQPPHLRHLALVKDTIITPEKRYVHYVYRTHSNYQKAVELGHASWEAVSKATETDELQDNALDEWGFRKANPKDYHPNGSATLTECQALIPKASRGTRYWDNDLAKAMGYEKPKRPGKSAQSSKVFEIPRTVVMTRAEAEAASLLQHDQSGDTEQGSILPNSPDVHNKQTTPRKGSAQKGGRKSLLLNTAQREALGLPLKGRLGQAIEKQIRDHREKTGDPTSLPDILIKDHESQSPFKYGGRPLLTMEERAARGLPIKGRLKKSIEDAIRKERGISTEQADSRAENDNPGTKPERLTNAEREARGMKRVGRPLKSDRKRKRTRVASEAAADENPGETFDEPNEGVANEPNEGVADKANEGGAEDPDEEGTETPHERGVNEPNEGVANKPKQRISDTTNEEGAENANEKSAENLNEGGVDELSEGVANEPSDGISNNLNGEDVPNEGAANDPGEELHGSRAASELTIQHRPLVSQPTAPTWTAINASKPPEPTAPDSTRATSSSVGPRQIASATGLRPRIAESLVARSSEVQNGGAPSTSETSTANASKSLDIDRSISVVSEIRPTPSPRPRIRKTQSPKPGVSRGKGSVLMLRKSIVLDIMNRCGGVYPYNGEIYKPFESLWLQRLGSRMPVPDRTTQKATVESLINTPGSNLKKMTFQLPKLGGNETMRRTILVYGDIGASSPQVMDLQQKMTQCWPKHYYPAEVHDLVDMEPKVWDFPVFEQDYTIELEPLHSRRGKGLRDGIAEEELNQRIMNSVRERKNKYLNKAKNLEEMNATGEQSVGTRKRSQKKRARLTTAHELPAPTGESTHSFQVANVPHRVGEVTRSSAFSESLTNPVIVFSVSNGTFSTGFSVPRQAQSSQNGSLGTVATAQISKSRKRVRYTSDEGDDAHTARKKHRTSASKAKKKKKKTKVVDLNPSLPERLVGLTGDPDDPIYIPPEIKKAMQKADINEPQNETEETTDESPQEPSAETFEDASGQATEGEPVDEAQVKNPRARGPKKPKKAIYRSDPINNIKKLLCTLVIATNLSEDAGNIDWSIVRKVYRPEDGYEIEHLKRLWSWARMNRGEYLDSLTERFQSCFLKAYEVGEIKALDGRDTYETYNWDALAEWAVQISPRYPQESLPPEDWDTIQKDFFIDKSTYKVFDRESWVKEKISNKQRKIRIRKYIAALPLHQQVHQTTPHEDLILQARSVIRSNIATDQSTFDAHQAHEKFRSFEESILRGVVENLMSRKLIQMIKIKRLRPGRNFHFTKISAKLFRCLFQLEDFMSAVDFKKSLDVAFSHDDPAERIMQPRRTAEDGAVMALLSLLSAGYVNIIPKPPPINNDPDSEERRTSCWGYMTAEYAQRKIDRQLLFWPIDIVPTSSYEFGNPLQPSPAPMIPLEEKTEPGTWTKLRDPPLPGKDDPTALLPIWSSVSGESVTWPWWNRILNMVIQVVQWRPGSNAAFVYEQCNKGTVEMFEIKLVLSWLVDVGAAVKIDAGAEPTFKMTPLWWTVFGDELIGNKDDWFGNHVRRKKKKNFLDEKMAERFLPAKEQNINLAWTEEELQEYKKNWTWMNVQAKPYSPEPSPEPRPAQSVEQQSNPQPVELSKTAAPRQRGKSKAQAIRDSIRTRGGRISKVLPKSLHLPRGRRTMSQNDEDAQGEDAQVEESEQAAMATHSEDDARDIPAEALPKTKEKKPKIDRRRRPPKDQVFYFGKEPRPEEPDAGGGEDVRAFVDPNNRNNSGYGSGSGSGARSVTDKDGNVQMANADDDDVDAEGEIDEEYLALTPTVTTPASGLSTTPAPHIDRTSTRPTTPALAPSTTPAPTREKSKTPAPTSAVSPGASGSLALDALRKAVQEGYQFNRREEDGDDE